MSSPPVPMDQPERLVAAAAERAGSGEDGRRALEGWVGEALARLVQSLNAEAGLSETGAGILRHRLTGLLANRLRVEEEHRRHPEIGEEQVEGPIFVVGLPRTGTTATSQLLAADPQIRSLRLWESTEPVPPPEAATQHDDPRIAATQAGLDLMYEVFPRMRSLYFQTATGATECQDLLGMSMRTAHFDGMALVPSYTRWVLGCDMVPAYAFHRRVLQMLQWHCPPRLWHLKTPVHLLSLEALTEAYPDARFLWTHRDPAAVLGSVCSLIAYTRSWVGATGEAREIGRQQLALWKEALGRGMRFRERVGEDRFADVHFGPLNTDPVATMAEAYRRLGLELGERAAAAMAAWAEENPAGGRGVHEHHTEDFGLDDGEVRRELAAYVERFDVPTG